MMEVRNLAEAHQALQVHTTDRARVLDTFERYVDGKQYEGRASWWDDSKPLFERAPAVVYPIVQSAISSHVAMVLGGHRFPAITSGADEDDSEFDSEFGISEADSVTLDRFIKVMSRQCRLQVVCRQLLTKAMSCGTCVAIPCIRAGRLCVDVVPAKYCDVEFTEDSDCVVEKLEYKFPYIDTKERDAYGRKVAKCYVFRRVIDELYDTTYEPAEVSSRADIEPTWKVKRRVKHELGFCPVVWYKFRPTDTSVASPDGEPVHVNLLDEIVAMDFAISQRHRATLFCTDPILVEIGVEPGHNPTGIGESPVLFAPNGDRIGDHSSMAQWAAGGPSRARNTGRQRSPGKAYQYPNPETSVALLTLPADSMKAATDNAADIEQKICETLHWKPVDPKEMRSGATLSGRALEMLNTKQLEYCDVVRSEFGPECVLRLVDMMLRIVLRAASRDEGVYVAGLGQVLPILQRFLRKQEQRGRADEDVWMTPELRLKWGDYIEPNEQDQKARGECIRADLEAGIIKLSTAVEANAPFYRIENPAKYAKDMEREAEERAAALHEANALLVGAKEQPSHGGEEADAAPPMQ